MLNKNTLIGDATDRGKATARKFGGVGVAPNRSVKRFGVGLDYIIWPQRKERAMEALPSHAEYFGHVRTIIGMVLGLSLARLVNGLTRFVQHPGTIKVYPVHLGWVIFLFITIVHFWWYEFHLALVPVWTFPLYGFLIFYTMVFAALTALLFPDQMTEYKGFEDYFGQRKRWFFGLLAFVALLDVGDTMIKGYTYLRSLGPEYPVRQVAWVFLSIAAMFISSSRGQMALVLIAIVYQISWIIRLYDIL
jgi:hypothetical protein